MNPKCIEGTEGLDVKTTRRFAARAVIRNSTLCGGRCLHADDRRLTDLTASRTRRESCKPRRRPPLAHRVLVTTLLRRPLCFRSSLRCTNDLYARWSSVSPW
jgi:hypothetical protein